MHGRVDNLPKIAEMICGISISEYRFFDQLVYDQTIFVMGKIRQLVHLCDLFILSLWVKMHPWIPKQILENSLS